MTDIKIKRYADKENLKKLMKYSKNTFANKSEINKKFYTKEQIDTMLESGSGGGGGTGGGTGGDYYTKSEIDTKLNSKANDSDVVHKSGDETIAGTKTFTSTSVGNVTGNASTATTATKLATARTIALSGAATGTATGFDGSGDIVIPVTALSGSAITSAITIYDLVPDGAANHRNFYRGKDLTVAFTAGTGSANIANGTFKDIFPGHYITKSITLPQILTADGTTEHITQKTYTVNFVIADLDVWLHRGYPSCETHHVAIVPQSVVFNSCMNETNTTRGGYKGSFMNTNVMPAFGKALRNAFGNDHILQFNFFDTNAVNNDLKPGGIVNFTGATYWGNNGHDWASHYCHLMTETMVYGAPITASCAADEIMGGVQMAAFRLNNNLFYNGQVYWLSDVVSSAYFAHFGFVGGGGVGADGASSSLGVRPFALLV